MRRSELSGSPIEVAPQVLNTLLVVEDRVARIVEVEAYWGSADPASHAHRGPTPRTMTMFGPAGSLYVYRSYGIHWCLNFVCAREGSASAVLIRALIPTTGLIAMRRRRGILDERALCSGPGKLCEALGISSAQNGLAVDVEPFALIARKDPPDVAVGVRIGITKAADEPWRYGLRGSKYLSRPIKPL